MISQKESVNSATRLYPASGHKGESMENNKKGMTRREFLKRNLFVVAALAFLGSPFKSFADIFKGHPLQPNVSDKEARYYKTLAG